MIDLMTAYDPGRPFSRAEALHHGLTDIDLAHYVRLMHGIYLAPSRPVTPLMRAHAALLHFGRRAYASHQTAARVYGLPVPPGPEHVSTPERLHVHRRTHVIPHRAEAGQQIVRIDGVRVAPLMQVFVELGSQLNLVDLVVVADAILQRGLVRPEAMDRYLAGSSLNGTVLARRAWGHARVGAESPMETRSRMLIVLAGLPEPVVNETIVDERGTRRHDLRYPASRTVVEYDGSHHRSQRRWEQDLERRRDSEDAGDRMIVWTSRDLYVAPGDALGHLHSTLLSRGEPGVPRRLKPAWTRHFPARNAA